MLEQPAPRDALMRQDMPTTRVWTHCTRGRGFTLLELVVAMAVAAIVLTIGIPSFLNFIRNNRLTAESSDFMGALALTRNTAAVRGTPVSLGQTGSTAGDYTSGWQVWIDPNGNGVLDSGEQVIRVYTALDGGDTLVNAEGASSLTYLSTGFPSTAGTILHFKLCGPVAGSQGRQITISPAGTPHVSNVGC